MATSLLVIAIGLGPGPVWADAGTEATWRAACKHDALTFCSWQALTRDRPGVRDCLVRNVSKVSDACRGVIKAAESAVKVNE